MLEEYTNNQKIKQELFNLLNPVVETETGNDDIVYGNYIEWPYLNELDDDMLLNIADILGVNTEGTDKNKLIDKLINSGYEEGTEYENGNIDFLNSEKYYNLNDNDE